MTTKDNAIAEMERLLDSATVADRTFTDAEQQAFDNWKRIALFDTKEASMETQDIEQPTHPTRPLGAPAVHTRQLATPAALLRGAIALACGERGVDCGLASEFDRAVRSRFPTRKFEGAVAMTAKALLVAKSPIGAVAGGLAAATTGDAWLDSLFFRVDDAIPGPRLASALGVVAIVGTEDRLHVTKLDGRVVPAWVARDGDVPDTDASWDAIEVEPKTIGCNVMVKRSALLYSTHPSVEPFLMQDLREALLSALDAATLYGSGTGNEPTGVALLANPGHDLDSLASAYLIRNQLLAYQRSDDGMRWLLPDLAEGRLATTAAFAGATTPVVLGGTLAGYPYVLNALSASGSPPSTQQQYLAGNFGFVHLCVWDSVSIMANPYGAGYKSGSIELRVLADANVLVRDEKRVFAGNASILAA